MNLPKILDSLLEEKVALEGNEITNLLETKRVSNGILCRYLDQDKREKETTLLDYEITDYLNLWLEEYRVLGRDT